MSRQQARASGRRMRRRDAVGKVNTRVVVHSFLKRPRQTKLQLIVGHFKELFFLSFADASGSIFFHLRLHQLGFFFFLSLLLLLLLLLLSFPSPPSSSSSSPSSSSSFSSSSSWLNYMAEEQSGHESFLFWRWSTYQILFVLLIWKSPFIWIHFSRRLEYSEFSRI